MDWIPAIATLLGALLMMIYRTYKSLKAGEEFDPNKIIMALTATAAIMGTNTALMWGDNVQVQGRGIFGVCLYAFVSGWGAVKGASEVMRLRANGKAPEGEE